MDQAGWRALERDLLVRQDLKVSTAQKTIRNLRTLEAAGVDLVTADVDAYEAFVEKRKLAGARGTALQHYYKAFRRLRVARRLSISDLECPRAEEPDVELAPDDITLRLLNYHVGADDQDDVDVELARFAFRYGHFTGTRPELEHVRPRVHDYNRETRELWVWAEKTERGRTLQLEPWLAKIFEHYLDRIRPRVDIGVSSQLLLRANGRPWTASAYRAWLTDHGKSVYSWWYPYLARHWSVTYRLVETKLDIISVGAWHGHRSWRTTQRYAHVADRILRARMASHEVPPPAGLALA